MIEYIFYGLTALMIIIVFFYYNQIRKINSKERIVIVFDNNGEVIKSQKVFVDGEVKVKIDGEENSYITSKDYWYNIYKNKYFQFFNEEDIEPLEIHKIESTNYKVEPRTLYRLFKNNWVREISSAASSNPFNFDMKSIMIYGVGGIVALLILVSMFI